jgi:predicted SnoaL-like aldol condensation-catalyzing enzyme
MTETQTVSDPRRVVTTAVGELFGDKDPSAVDRWVSPSYCQHSSLAADGPDALRDLVANLPSGFSYESARVIADGDLVAMHGTYLGFGPDPLVAFDVFRVEDGKLAEHWDGLTPVVAQTVSGRSQVDGPTQPSPSADTEASRELVTTFAQQVLVGADYSVLTDFISTETYDQHNPGAGDGLGGFGDAVARWTAEGKNLDYRTIHHVIADHDFVLVHCEGTFGVEVAYWDLFRVQDGKIVEHWDVIAPVPPQLPHNNGVF